jgi:hypothetical protein
MRNLGAGLVALAFMLTTVPAGAVDASTIAINSAVRNGAAVTVQGLLTLGDDALTPVTVSEDAAGDARLPAGGFDIGNSTVGVDYTGTSPRLVVTQLLNDGAADADGNPPAQGFSWPIQVDAGSGDPLWLAAGSRGTNIPPGDAWWTGLCTAGEDGWICGTPLPGSVTTDAITWNIPFSSLGAKAGKSISASTAFGASPRSFVWPSVIVTQSTAPIDSAPAPLTYLIPGLVEAGIAPVGTHPGLVGFNTSAPFAHRTGAYTLNVPAPASPGTYTVWVRSCFGDPEDSTCVLNSQDVVL